MSRSFRIDIPAEAVADLKARLRRTRWPEGVLESGGIAKADVSRLVDYWHEGFDWFAQQDRLNQLPQLLVPLGEVSIHVVCARGTRPNAPAIVLLHGWPGSFVEFLEVASHLRSHFDVYIPSIPGYGFSSIPRQPGMSNARIAEVVASLMTALGRDQFAVHGGDIGAGVASWLALKYPERIAFLHLNFIPGSYAPEESSDRTPEEESFARRRAEWVERFGAYGHIHRTTPLTAAYGLSDSPAALAATIAEKFRLWADPASTISDDTILTNVSVYWFTNTAASSMRYYLESAATPLRIRNDARVTVDTHVAQFPHEMPFPPRSWVERGYSVRRWSHMPRGGHFAALEAPALLAEDIIAALQ